MAQSIFCANPKRTSGIGEQAGDVVTHQGVRVIRVMHEGFKGFEVAIITTETTHSASNPHDTVSVFTECRNPVSWYRFVIQGVIQEGFEF